MRPELIVGLGSVVHDDLLFADAKCEYNMSSCQSTFSESISKRRIS